MTQRNIAALVVSCLILAGCGGLGEREAEAFQRSRAALDSGDWAAAAELAASVIEVEPDYGPAYLVRAKARMQLGSFHEAVEDLTAAEARGGLDEDERFDVTVSRARCWIETARIKVADADFRSEAVPPDLRREARDLFVKANDILQGALRVRPDDYDANQWRGFALLRLENFRKAVEVLKTCERIAPARWEHRFFIALAWEGMYRINSQSLDTYFSIVEAGPREAFAPVYEHLAAISPEVAPEAARKIHARVKEYAAAVPVRSSRIDKFLAEATARAELERRQLRLKSTVERVQELLEAERFRDAKSSIESYLKEEAAHPEMARLIRDTQETWSQLLEARTEALLGSGQKEKLETALSNFELSRKLTSKVDRLVVLQQKINVVQLALTRFETSRKIQVTHHLLKTGKYQEVLQALAGTSVEGLSDHDRDLYHYLRGVASYQLGQWAGAVKSFSAMSGKNFDNLDVFHGMALVRAGQEAAGIAMLINIPAESRGDDVNRILGQHFAERGEHRKAVAYLAAIKNPAPADLEAHLRTRKKMGLECFDRGDYPRAVEELQAARQILEGQLHGRAVDVYLHLGHAYFRMEDFERAKKTYNDLSESSLTAVEREQSKDLFLYRGQIHLKEKNPELAFKDFVEFARLGGQMPQELGNTHGRLVAMYADFMPMDKVQYWNYTSTAKDYNYTLFVKEEKGGEYRIERKEGGNISDETWSRQGIYLTKQVKESVMKLPLNLHPAEESLPFTEYTSQGQQCTSEVVAVQQTVDTPGGRRFADCLKVRVRRTNRGADGQIHSTKHIFYFAPNVGEVKQEVYRDDTKVSEIVLSDFAYRTADVGN